MNMLKVSVDECEFDSKPNTEDVKKLSNRIASSSKEIDQTNAELRSLALSIGKKDVHFVLQPLKMEKGPRTPLSNSNCLRWTLITKILANRFQFKRH